MSDDREPLDHSLDAMLAKIAAREVPEPAASTADSAPSVGEVVGEGELGRVGRYRLRRLLGVGGRGGGSRGVGRGAGASGGVEVAGACADAAGAGAVPS